MSPSTIGGIIGAGIGFVVGGPAGARWGWMLGGMAGSIISPERYEGPRLDEARVQTSQDGVPLIYGYGTFPCMGNLAWIDEVKEHRHKRKAKGTPEQVDYTYTRSYMIVVCKGEISGYKIIKRNGKIVYDARTDAELSALGYSSQEIAETRAAQSKFLQIATLYYGTDTQMPDPTMVAVKGAGNVPAYTGIAYIVLKDDETREGETAQFEFVVANCGEVHDEPWTTDKLLITGQPLTTGSAVIAVADAAAIPVFEGVDQSTGANLDDCIPAQYGDVWYAAVDNKCLYHVGNDFDVWTESTIPFGAAAEVSSIAAGPAGVLVGGGSGVGPWLAKAPPVPSSFSVLDMDVEYNPGFPQPLLQIQQARYLDRYYVDALGSVGGYLAASDTLSEETIDMLWRVVDNNVLRPFTGLALFRGALWAASKKEFGTGRKQLVYSLTGGTSWEPEVLDFPGNVDIQYHPDQLAAGLDLGGYEALVVLCPGEQYFWTSADNFAQPHSTGIASTAGSRGAVRIVYAGRRFYIVSGSNDGPGSDPALGNKCVVVSINLNQIDVSAPIALPLTAIRGIASSIGTTSYEPIPDAPGYYINRLTGEIVGPPGTQIDPCEPNLAQLVADQCNRRGVSTIDVSELTDPVTGYRVAAPSTSQRNIQGLQPGYFFSASEFDGVLHFPKRGRNLTFALTHDDFVDRDGDPIQWETTQEAELPRKVTVAYVDPATSYSPTTQQAERRAATVKAEGETAIELAITGQKDWAAQVSDKAIKVSWGESEECTFHVTIDHAELVTGAEGTVPYLDGSTTVVRIERIEDEGLVRMVTARRTRKNLYESNASGAAKPLPRFPGSNIRGATDGLLLNIPILIDSDDRPGIHWAASRMMSGWAGGQFQILRAGQWVVAGETSDSAAMGALLSPLPYHSGDIDTANVLRIRINDDLESVTFTNLLQERNPLAILRPDGTAEIVQFQTATETAPGEYTLTNLLRNRVNTGASSHATDARVVFLDERVQYATLEPTDIGQTLTYRFVSFGTDPDAAPIQTYTLATMESQMEWPVYDFQVEQDGDDFHLTWRRRDRLGTDVFPIRSANWVGYTVGWQYSGMVHQEDVTNENITFTLPGASNITFNVSQINQFTGNGPATTVYIP